MCLRTRRESLPRFRAEIRAFRKANVSAIRGDVTEDEVAESDVIDPESSKLQPNPAHCVDLFQAASVYNLMVPGGRIGIRFGAGREPGPRPVGGRVGLLDTILIPSTAEPDFVDYSPLKVLSHTCSLALPQRLGLIFRIWCLWKGRICSSFSMSHSMESASIKSETLKCWRASGAGPKGCS
ncbi:hypothetical protein F2Q70_00018970 [Brassica cretica]|uniref:Uncharacterized protein n=1 Tax=Brassica cretica TaxID=69181 RepID=A0A8S9HSR3_BRACR|nr:hypothetical protein F2Q70_00018970 [Brassica cretica]